MCKFFWPPCTSDSDFLSVKQPRKSAPVTTGELTQFAAAVFTDDNKDAPDEF